MKFVKKPDYKKQFIKHKCFYIIKGNNNVMSILNLTRKILPSITKNTAQNIANVKNMPEVRLSLMMREGNNKIVQVGMNECKAVRILPDKINTIYTDGLASCNAVGVVCRGLDKNPVVILSHYTPLETSRIKQAQTLDAQLKVYEHFIDKSVKPKVYYNVPGYKSEDEGLKPCVNNIFEKINSVMKKFFGNNFDEQIVLYPHKNRPAYFSSANIYQFDPKKTNDMKITFVGEKEQFCTIG